MEENKFKTFYIKELNLNFRIIAAWSVSGWELENEKCVYQQIENTGGIIFIRFGSNSSLEYFKIGSTDSQSRLNLLYEQNVQFMKAPGVECFLNIISAVRKVYSKNPMGGFCERYSDEKIEYIRLVSSQYNSIPLLLGYRINTRYRNLYEDWLNLAFENLLKPS